MENWEKVEAIIDRALGLPVTERETYINEQCGNNEVLKSEVTELLNSIFVSEGWLENPHDYKQGILNKITKDLDEIPTSRSLIGLEIGSYTIREKIGEGGMGTVYRAERSDGAFEHQVAIKIIRNEKATDRNIHRFKRERNILASMNHPGIAKLFDGGITEDGYPYFVMEYVDGMPITEYCRDKKSSISQRINLFRQVLDAVQHAHENLIVHRDLKPGNILVSASGEVKILDFGISKLLEQEDLDEVPLTQTHARALTLKYAAPEQILHQSITTATDTYALGIVLYELLSDSYPFNFEKSSRYDREQQILNELPPKPNTLSSNANKEKLKGDLDAIILKSIRKEPNRRYRSAKEFQNDLDRYENTLPVTAQIDSVSYRLQKFLHRHSSRIVTGAAILLLTIAFSIFYTWRITNERNQAKMEAKKAGQITEFLMDLFESELPNRSKGKTITAEMLVQQGIRKANQLHDQPEVEARMLVLLGEINFNLGKYNQADSLIHRGIEIQKEFSDADEAYVGYLNTMGELLQQRGDFDAADSVIIQALKLARQHGFRKKEAISLNNLGNLAQKKSQYKRAEKLHRQSLDIRLRLYEELGTNLPASYNNIGLALQSQGKFDEAEKYYRKALRLNIDSRGKSHSETTLTMRNLTQLYIETNRLSQADSLLEEIIKIDRKLLGHDHPRIAEDLNELAVINAKKGNYAVSDSLFLEILEIQHQTLDPNHPRIALTLNNLSWVALRENEISRAEEYNREALAIARQRFGNEHRNTAIYGYNLAKILLKEKKYEGAEALFRESLASLKKTLPETHPRIADGLLGLGQLLNETNRPEEAASILQKAVAIQQKQHRDSDRVLALIQAELGNSLLKLGQLQKAERLLNNSYQILEGQNPNESQKVKSLLTKLHKMQSQT